MRLQYRGQLVCRALLFFVSIVSLEAQTLTEAPEVWCPSVLGIGVVTQKPYCDIQVQVEPQLAIRVVLPPRQGQAILSFDLHNRHTYSEQEESVGRAYAEYLASVAVATMDGEIIGRGVVMSEFRAASDLVDRISGGAGETGLRAVAPTGTERIRVTVPEDLEELVIAGQSLDVVQIDVRDTVTGLGRPVAVLSAVLLEYSPR